MCEGPGSEAWRKSSWTSSTQDTQPNPGDSAAQFTGSFSEIQRLHAALLDIQGLVYFLLVSEGLRFFTSLDQ